MAHTLAQSKWEMVGLEALDISRHATRVDVASTRGKECGRAQQLQVVTTSQLNVRFPPRITQGERDGHENPKPWLLAKEQEWPDASIFPSMRCTLNLCSAQCMRPGNSSIAWKGMHPKCRAMQQVPKAHPGLAHCIRSLYHIISNECGSAARCPRTISRSTRFLRLPNNIHQTALDLSI